MMDITSKQLERDIEESIARELLFKYDPEIINKYRLQAEKILKEYTLDEKRQALCLVVEGSTYNEERISYLEALEKIHKITY